MRRAPCACGDSRHPGIVGVYEYTIAGEIMVECPALPVGVLEGFVCCTDIACANQADVDVLAGFAELVHSPGVRAVWACRLCKTICFGHERMRTQSRTGNYTKYRSPDIPSHTTLRSRIIISQNNALYQIQSGF
ncbi:hypothetical protein ES703_53554 [subsurface metagenome]